jgi:predicted nucleic acid-binding protein
MAQGMAQGKLIVLDTNVVVSALLSSQQSPPVEIVSLAVMGLLTLCYDARIMSEYREVLQRPRFDFNPKQVRILLSALEQGGLPVDPLPLKPACADPDDQAFYEVAQLCFCPLITGNKRHFPPETGILSPREYLKSLQPL